MRHRDDGGDDRLGIRAAAEPLDEHAIDLDGGHRIALQIGHRREAGAEIVEGDLVAHRGQFAQHRLDRLARVEQQAFRDLEPEARRRDGGLGDALAHEVHQPPAELTR